MRYPLIFPHGKEGWHSRIPLTDINLNDNVNLHACCRTHVNFDNEDDVQNAPRHGRGGSTRVSQSNYYTFKLQNREAIFFLFFMPVDYVKNSVLMCGFVL